MQLFSAFFRNRSINNAFLWVLCVAGPVFLAAILKGTPGKIVTSDGNGYYAWLTTLTADADLRFYNDLINLYTPDDTRWIEEAGENVVNVYPPGLAIVMSPGFIVAHVSSKILGAVDIAQHTPYDPFYKIITAAWMFVFYLFGIYFFQRLLEKFTHNRLCSAACALTIVLGSNLVHYISKEPSMTHGTIFSLTSITSLLLVSARESSFKSAVWIGAGALVGLMLAVRNSTIALLPWWILLGWNATNESWKIRSKAAVIAGIAALSVFSVQPILLSLMAGKFTLNAYPTYGLSAGLEGIWKGLLSSRHGLFAYHPIWAAVIVGVVVSLLQKNLRLYAMAALLCFLCAVYINGTWPNWWFGDSFGNRAYLDVLAPCSLVAATALFSWLEKKNQLRMHFAAAVTALTLIVANLTLWVGFLLRRFPADGLHSYSEAWLWWLG
ncbi:MAG: hypothetical protein RL189_2034 [Pseudomonadota bacterium]|jgi:hypothetical protein